MENLLYVVLNKELKMSAGKAAAQAVHAAMMLQSSGNGFADNYRRTVIVLEAGNSEQIRNLETYLDEAGIFCQKYIDEGVNEISAYSITALAVEPIDAEDEEKRQIFAPFKLFNSDPYEAVEAGLEAISRDYVFGRHDFVPRIVKKALKWVRKNK